MTTGLEYMFGCKLILVVGANNWVVLSNKIQVESKTRLWSAWLDPIRESTGAALCFWIFVFYINIAFVSLSPIWTEPMGLITKSMVMVLFRGDSVDAE